jgi:ParB family chromosome partitioning protein
MAKPRATPKTTSPAKKRKRKGVKIESVALPATEIPLETFDETVQALVDAVRADGGALIGAYREPLGGKSLLFVAIPIELVEPTSFQRDVSDSHVRKLVRAMDKTKRFLDPVIMVRKDGKYLTPNGNHRLRA